MADPASLPASCCAALTPMSWCWFLPVLHFSLQIFLTSWLGEILSVLLVELFFFQPNGAVFGAHPQFPVHFDLFL